MKSICDDEWRLSYNLHLKSDLEELNYLENIFLYRITRE